MATTESTNDSNELLHALIAVSCSEARLCLATARQHAEALFAKRPCSVIEAQQFMVRAKFGLTCEALDALQTELEETRDRGRKS